MVALGLIFGVPLILLALVRGGLIQHERFAKSRALVFVISLITVALLITPDYFSCLIIAVPMQLVLQICIWISAGLERQKKRKELAREKAGT